MMTETGWGSYSAALDQGEHLADIEHWHLGMIRLRGHGPTDGDQTVLPMGVFHGCGSRQHVSWELVLQVLSIVGGIWRKAWHYHFPTKLPPEWGS